MFHHHNHHLYYYIFHYYLYHLLAIGVGPTKDTKRFMHFSHLHFYFVIVTIFLNFFFIFIFSLFWNTATALLRFFFFRQAKSNVLTLLPLNNPKNSRVPIKSSRSNPSSLATASTIIKNMLLEPSSKIQQNLSLCISNVETELKNLLQ